MNRFGADAVNPTDERAKPKDSIALLAIAFRHAISEPTVEAGYERIITPVRLPEGALQCHWRLELTREVWRRPGGLVAFRATVDADADRATRSASCRRKPQNFFTTKARSHEGILMPPARRPA